ncbi:MAG: M61 family metallopeptidase [Williamsia sp.]|nr:M61 family metallopeptidase [Williamsia sp.]
MRQVFILFLFVSLCAAAAAQKIRYEVSFPNVAHHEASIALIASGIPKTAAVFRMSRSSPGRYATHEFGKNVYDVKAFDKEGVPIAINRTEGDVYEVPKHEGWVRVVYTLYGNYADGTYAGIDPQSIHLNMPASFMWMKGMDAAPIEIKFNAPAGNAGKIATQLKPTTDPTEFTAPGLQYFMDSPTKIGDLILKEWDVKNGDGKTFHFRIAFDIAEGKDKVDPFTEKVKRLVEEEKAVFGEFPQYDYGTYTFLASINPYVHGDGMEHRNSTMISFGGQFDGGDELLDIFAHEFFHNWNVERIRPKTLEPFNFEKSNMSNELWLAEGFTQYYGNLLVERAGLSTSASLIANFTGMINSRLNTPGATGYTPIDASRQAVFTDAGVSVDRTNYPNIFTSYYYYGAATALALDMELRSRFNKSLDNFMQALWKRFGKTEVPYTVATVQEELGRLTTPAFAQEFFTRYIYGHEPVDYTDLFAKFGYVVKRRGIRAWLGNNRLIATPKGMQVGSNTIRNTPLYNAGIDVDDIIEKIDGKEISKEDALSNLLELHKPGDVVEVQFSHRGVSKTAPMRLMQDPANLIVSFEEEGIGVTPAVKKLRDEWLGSKL